MISKTPLRSGSPLRVFVELGTVGRCALAESCRTAARSNGDIGQSENPHFRFLAAVAPGAVAPLLLRILAWQCPGVTRCSAPVGVVFVEPVPFVTRDRGRFNEGT